MRKGEKKGMRKVRKAAEKKTHDALVAAQEKLLVELKGLNIPELQVEAQKREGSQKEAVLTLIDRMKFERSLHSEFRYETECRYAESHDPLKPMSNQFDMPETDLE